MTKAIECDSAGISTSYPNLSMFCGSPNTAGSAAYPSNDSPIAVQTTAESRQV
jgi:hypothetical protein